MLRNDTRGYLRKMRIQIGCLKMRMNTQAKPSKMQGRSLRHYSEFECRIRKGHKRRVQGEGNLNTTPYSLNRGACPSASESPLSVAEGYTASPPGEETWASWSLSSIDNSHASMTSHLRSNIRLSSVFLLMSLSFAAGSKFGRRLDVSLIDQQRLSLTYSASCVVSRKEGKAVVLPLNGPLANTGFVGRSTGREAYARRSLQPLSPRYPSTRPQSNFRMAHITQSMVSLCKRLNSVASAIIMAKKIIYTISGVLES
ncbi:hypothetical protein Cgig2_018532 [Carnegiea gigantea]|uniref:Uncharacterized protein n=1 Tax=Carnegiea gigantea TaxID=171969 RepID=A0A9Q1QL46_9CARY|nr:hypothetical protein Cgig2_018532 [Carnegiea gigantea]